MRHITIGFLTLAVALGPAAASAASRFDGNWSTTITCENARDALGYTLHFASTVTNGVLHGVYGTPGQASSLQIDGTLTPAGAVSVLAQGRTGSKEFVPGRDTPRGSPYAYHLMVQFNGNAGSGRRTEGRPCTAEFTRP